MVMEEEISEEELQQLRSRATELLLGEDWKKYISLYSHFISLHHHHLSNNDNTKLRKCLCMALSNKAEALHRLGHLQSALEDCDKALLIDPSYRKALVCKGKILLELDRYSSASDCFHRVLSTPSSNGNSDNNGVRGLLDRCRRLEAQSRNGTLDLSSWVLGGFKGESPEIAEYVGPVEIKKSGNGGSGARGLFSIRSVEAGTTLVVTKAVVIGRGILPEETGNGSGERGRMVMWKDFVDRLLEAAARCRRTLRLIYALSAGEETTGVAIPDMGLFRPEGGEEGSYGLPFSTSTEERPDTDRILNILDVNCLTEEGAASKVLGRNDGGCGGGYCAVGLWILPSFVNHSCRPNARRLHIGDKVVVHASRDVKAGEELTFAYFDVLQPLQKRRELAKSWGFHCRCERCEFEEEALGGDYGEELKELEAAALLGTADPGEVVAKLEEGMVKNRKWAAKGKEKGFLRASFWGAYCGAYGSERSMRKWGRRIPAEAVAAESAAGAVGGDERVLKVVVDGAMKGGRSGGGMGEETMERAMRVGKGVYGKVMKKKQAMRALLEEVSCNSR